MEPSAHPARLFHIPTGPNTGLKNKAKKEQEQKPFSIKEGKQAKTRVVAEKLPTISVVETTFLGV
jgi:hypothetical protein